MVWAAHTAPSKPAAQAQAPDTRLQVPRLEHSASACAVSAAVASSNQLTPVGQLRFWHENPE